MRILISVLVDEISLPRYVDWSINFRGLPFTVLMTLSCLKHIFAAHIYLSIYAVNMNKFTPLNKQLLLWQVSTLVIVVKRCFCPETMPDPKVVFGLRFRCTHCFHLFYTTCCLNFPDFLSTIYTTAEWVRVSPILLDTSRIPWSHSTMKHKTVFPSISFLSLRVMLRVQILQNLRSEIKKVLQPM